MTITNGEKNAKLFVRTKSIACRPWYAFKRVVQGFDGLSVYALMQRFLIGGKFVPWDKSYPPRGKFTEL